MIINSNTPFRVSLFGGGTDYMEYFTKYGGIIIGGSINKYNNITLSQPIDKKKFILDFAETKTYLRHEKIWHPVIRKSLKMENIDSLKTSYSSDMFARSGIGSSSSFVLGFLNAINTLKRRKKLSQKELILKAYNFERFILNEYVGIQDHILCGLGGFNIIRFSKNNKINYSVKKININDKRIKFLNENLILYSTNKFRNASKIEKKKIESVNSNIHSYKEIHKISNIALKLFEDNKMHSFLEMIKEYWTLKKSLSNKVSNKAIDKMINHGFDLGAVSAKVIGAGGGGYVLFYCPKKIQKHFKFNFNKTYKFQDFKFDKFGSRIL